ncbi:unnamed protein product [Lymnaea stagnalis]|uniref:Ubiquitin-like domain-containing protein n=1 Tax=Lymnaea stagnalis TaxID=6523 RepID=A0AAV2I7Q0_LYMST
MSAEDQSHRSEFQHVSESVPFCKVALHVIKDHQEVTVHKADLDTQTLIKELKTQLKEDGIIKSDDQVWYLDGTELHDEKSLGYYDITGANKIYRDPIRINVNVNTLS